MNRLVKYFWFLSTGIFLITLLYVYAYLPGHVGIHAGAGGRPDQFIDKNTFFYLSVGLFLLTNISIMILRRLLQKVWLRNSATGHVAPNRLAVRRDVTDWLYAFAASLNIFFILILGYMAIFNNMEDFSNQGIYGPLVYTGPLLIGLVILALIYIFVKKR